MRGKREWRAYGVLSEPLTVLGVERRFFLLAAVLGAAIWNAVNSLLAGGLIFGAMYGAGLVAWKRDKHLLVVVRVAVRYAPRYEAAQLPEPAPYVVVKDA